MKKNNVNFTVYCLGLAAILAGGCASPALMNPSAKGDLAAVKALLEKGADPNEHRNAYANETALHMAVWNSHLEVAKYLLEHGADPNFEAESTIMGHKKYFGTPLVYAACIGKISMVQLLLEYGADPDPDPGICHGGTGFGDMDIGTPLQLAEKRGNTLATQMIKEAVSAKVGITQGAAQNANEYGPIVGALLKNYDGEGKTIAVAGFSYVDGHASSDGDTVAARVTTELIKLKKLNVVERREIEKVLGEMKLQNAGAIDQASAKKLGRMLGADLLVVGNMTELPGRKLELNVRLVGVESGVAISAVSGQVEYNWIGK